MALTQYEMLELIFIALNVIVFALGFAAGQSR